MADDYAGSIAQRYVTFSTTTTTTAVVGDNFKTVMIFVGHAEGATLFASGSLPAIGGKIELTATTYSSLTLSTLLAWLTTFYDTNALTTVIVVVYDDSTVATDTFPADAVTALTTQYTTYKYQAYFKLMSLTQNAANVALATLCQADRMVSQCWIGSSDAQLLVDASTTSIYALCKAAGDDPVIVYKADTTVNGALVQLGISLGTLNSTGTPVGNSLDYVATSIISASGASGANLATTDVTTLTGHNIGFFLTVGNTTGEVALKGGKTALGNVACAQWITGYIDYVSSIEVAQLIAQLNMYKNNETYQLILAIVRKYVSDFKTLGRFSSASGITAPSFQKLPTAAGDTITVPNAWVGYYVDNLRKVTVTGTLYIVES